MTPSVTNTTTTTERRYTLSGRDILQMLLKEIPPDAIPTVTFRVPGGGDWANAVIEIDDQHPITVKVTTRT